MGAERGQASVEVLGALPVVLLVGAVLLQLLALGYSAALAGSAAEAGALAAASGADVRDAARAAVPGWARGGARGGLPRARFSAPAGAPAPLARFGGAR